jgi:hypothetical protein
MYSNRSDPVKNRLYVRITGRLDAHEVAAARDDALRLASTLRPGFGVISDLAAFTPVHEDGRQIMLEAMHALKEQFGMGHVVRVVPESKAVAANQWQRTSRQVGYVAIEAPTLAAAEQLMDELSQGN